MALTRGVTGLLRPPVAESPVSFCNRIELLRRTIIETRIARIATTRERHDVWRCQFPCVLLSNIATFVNRPCSPTHPLQGVNFRSHVRCCIGEVMAVCRKWREFL